MDITNPTSLHVNYSAKLSIQRSLCAYCEFWIFFHGLLPALCPPLFLTSSLFNVTFQRPVMAECDLLPSNQAPVPRAVVQLHAATVQGDRIVKEKDREFFRRALMHALAGSPTALRNGNSRATVVQIVVLLTTICGHDSEFSTLQMRNHPRNLLTKRMSAVRTRLVAVVGTLRSLRIQLKMFA